MATVVSNQQQMGGGGGQMQQQTVVVNTGGNQGNKAYTQNIRMWSSGLFGCFEDCGSCLYAYFCFMLFLCTLASKLSESCCVPLFLQGGLMAMRTKTRLLYGITGSICDDWCCTTYCPQLAACQMDRELRICGAF